jgi:hypothetical protein
MMAAATLLIAAVVRHLQPVPPITHVVRHLNIVQLVMFAELCLTAAGGQLLVAVALLAQPVAQTPATLIFVLVQATAVQTVEPLMPLQLIYAVAVLRPLLRQTPAPLQAEQQLPGFAMDGVAQPTHQLVLPTRQVLVQLVINAEPIQLQVETFLVLIRVPLAKPVKVPRVKPTAKEQIVLAAVLQGLVLYVLHLKPAMRVFALVRKQVVRLPINAAVQLVLITAATPVQPLLDHVPLLNTVHQVISVFQVFIITGVSDRVQQPP